MPVLIDTSGSVKAAGLDRRHTHYVLSKGRRIYARQQFTDSGFEGALEELLPP